jgi:DNA-binding SARP family transcriptional activator
MSARVCVEMLGRAVIYVGDRRVEPSAEMVFAALLMLALERGEGFSRQQMAEMLWPEAPYATRAGRLRWLLSKLRAVDVPIDPRATAIALRSADVEWDVDTLSLSVPNGRGEILAGYLPSFSPNLREWLEETRRRVATSAVRSLLTQLERARTRADWKLAVDPPRQIGSHGVHRSNAAISRVTPRCS